MNDRSKKYFVLASQYYHTSKILLETIIQNNNLSIGIGFSEEEALIDFNKKIVKSDVYIFIPALFNSLQSVELFVKGLLLLNGKEIDYEHKLENSFLILKNIYGDKSEIYKSIKNFYNFQESVIFEFKKINNITTTEELYEALRYPENRNKKYDFSSLRFNGKNGVGLLKKLLEKLQKINASVLQEFRNNAKNY